MRERFVTFIRDVFPGGKRFETSKEIKKEFSDFLIWYKSKSKEMLDNKDTQVLIDEYFVEKDFALYGEMIKVKGANKRNATAELWLAMVIAVVGFFLVIFLINLFFK